MIKYNKTIAQIKAIYKNLNITELTKFIETYNNDERKQVMQLIQFANNKHIKYIKELKRLDLLRMYENEYYKKGYNLIAGTDEVGRGPLAGPVVAAMVILPKDFSALYINDSKKLTKLKREELDKLIRKNALSYYISSLDNDVVDDINISNAGFNCMKNCYENIVRKPDFVLVDGFTIPNFACEQLRIISGDSKSISIAAASIIAKVFRDNIMDEYDKIYPGYGFKNNKGYGTKEHLNAIKTLGLCKIHRKSFTKNLI